MKLFCRIVLWSTPRSSSDKRKRARASQWPWTPGSLIDISLQISRKWDVCVLKNCFFKTLLFRHWSWLFEDDLSVYSHSVLGCAYSRLEAEFFIWKYILHGVKSVATRSEHGIDIDLQIWHVSWHDIDFATLSLYDPNSAQNYYVTVPLWYELKRMHLMKCYKCFCLPWISERSLAYINF